MPKFTEPLDSWYVRFPDGHVVRAKDTQSVRRHITTGRIPLHSVARRTDEEEWKTLEWLTEFSDLIAQKRREQLTVNINGSTNGADELKTVGVRGVFGELLTAMESTLRARKLMIAGATMCIASAVTTSFRPFFLSQQYSIFATLVVAVLLLVLAGFSIALMTQTTFVELSRLRPAKWREAMSGFWRYGSQMTMLLTILAGSAFLITTTLRSWPRWILAEELYLGTIGPEPLAAIAQVLRVVIESVMWALLLLSPLLAPALVIEDTGPLTTTRRSWALLRRHGLRVFLYQSWVIVLGLVLALPLLIALAFAATGFGQDISPGVWATLFALGGLALTPFFAYVVVANVFIFINLRYETPTFADLRPH